MNTKKYEQEIALFKYLSKVLPEVHSWETRHLILEELAEIVEQLMQALTEGEQQEIKHDND